MVEGTNRQKQTPKHTRPLANSWSFFINLSNSYNINNIYVLSTLSESHIIFPFQYTLNLKRNVHFIQSMKAGALSYRKPASAGDLELFKTLLRSKESRNAGGGKKTVTSKCMLAYLVVNFPRELMRCAPHAVSEGQILTNINVIFIHV